MDRPRDAPLSSESDDGLVGRGRAGSAAALTELYHRYRGRLYGYAYRMTNDADLAEEVLCATFATLLKNLDRYRPAGNFAAYLFRIARSRLHDEQRARARLTGGDTSERQVEAVEGGAQPGDALARNEEAQKAQQALDRLPASLREVVVLRLYDGMSYADIAALIGEGEATVRSRMRYALQALRRDLGGADD